MQADEPRFHDPLFAHGRDQLGVINLGQWQRHVNVLRALDHVSIGHNVTVGIDDDSGADDIFAGDERGLAAVACFLSAEAGHENLNDCGGNASGQLLDGRIQLLQDGGRFRGVGSGGFGFVQLLARR